MILRTAADAQTFTSVVCLKLLPQRISSPHFREILRLPEPAVEIDRAHSQDTDNPRDIICKLHKYTLKKERIMQKMLNKPFFYSDGAYLFFYQDISRGTLMQRRALKPVLVALQEAGLPYRWGFPFYLQATKDGRPVPLRTKDDFPHFLSALGLGTIDFPDWCGDAAAIIRIWMHHLAPNSERLMTQSGPGATFTSQDQPRSCYLIYLRDRS